MESTPTKKKYKHVHLRVSRQFLTIAWKDRNERLFSTIRLYSDSTNQINLNCATTVQEPKRNICNFNSISWKFLIRCATTLCSMILAAEVLLRVQWNCELSDKKKKRNELSIRMSIIPDGFGNGPRGFLANEHVASEPLQGGMLRDEAEVAMIARMKRAKRNVLKRVEIIVTGPLIFLQNITRVIC